MQAIKEPILEPCKVIVFSKRMGAPNPIPQPQAEQPSGYHAPIHGTWAQWVAPAVALVIGIVSVSLMIHYRNEDNASKVSDEHIRNLVEDKFKPLNREVFDDKTGKLSEKIDGLGERMTRVEQRLDDLHDDLKKQSELQKDIRKESSQAVALARLQVEPADRLDKIRRDIQMAESKREPIPYSKLVDYKLAVHALPRSAADYWRTVGEIINYESYLEQIKGHAPDPATVARPCMGTTENSNMRYSMIENYTISNCILDLDTSGNAFVNVTFVNCVVRYHGGQATVTGVRFKNCRFQLDIPAEAPAIEPHRDRILFTLLDAPTLSDIHFGNGM